MSREERGILLENAALLKAKREIN